MDQHLIVLGAGATAAISRGTLPIAEDFFSPRNSTWSSNTRDYPHLAAACRRVASLKSSFLDLTPVSLTDVWLFLDTLCKYHSATRCNSPNTPYDYCLLRIRYEYDKKRSQIPDYLKPEYLNTNYPGLRSDMRPYFSALRKRIYDTTPQNDPVAYFLILAGWELKHLLYRTYDPQTRYAELYTRLLATLKHLEGIAVISFNYDIFFETTCQEQGVTLELLGHNHAARGKDAIPFCKPHGGWNIRHVDDRIEPFRNLAQFVEDAQFDGLPHHEERPAMIPYFSHPDEMSPQHEVGYPGVGVFFRNQQQHMQSLFHNARNVVSIGYSFSKHDIHVRQCVEKVSPTEPGRGKRVFCVLKGNSHKSNIMGLWKFDKEDGASFKYREGGLDDQSIDEIRHFLEC